MRSTVPPVNLHFREAARFLAAGSIITVLFYGLYSALIYLGLHYNIALFLVYALGVIFGYLLNKHWTFSSHGPITYSFAKYVATYVAVYLLNMCLLNFFMMKGQLNPYLGQLLSLAIVSSLSFLLQSYWVFGARTRKWADTEMLDNHSEYLRMSEVEMSHWWYVTLHQLVLTIVEKKQMPEDTAILDVGCGTGGLLKFLRHRGYTNLTGFDLSKKAVSRCQQSNLSVTQLDMLNMGKAYGKRRFDVIVSNDTLCYLDEASQADWALQCSQLLRPGGILIANVPAHDCFGGIHDRAVGIRQRFTPVQVRRIFQGSSLHVDRMLYWPFFLAPAIFLARAIQRYRLRTNPEIQIKSDIDLPWPRVNTALLGLCSFENSALPWKPIGSSLIISAENQQSQRL